MLDLDLTIYSYGYSEIIYHTLQAIAMFRNSVFYTAIITTVALFAGLVSAVEIVAARADDQWRQALRRVMIMVVFIHALMLPTTTMTIKDHVEKHFWRIDNIPLAFALPIGVIENFGHILTFGFEQVFSLVDGASAHSYYHYGSVFGARLQKEVLQAKVRDPEFINNMSNFIERCVILPSMIGKQFTKEELVMSHDMWGLISSRAGTFTRTPMTKNGVRVDPHPKCKDAVPYFEKKFDEAIGYNLTSWSWKFKGAGKSGEYNKGVRALNENIKAQIGAIYTNNSSVDALLKHNMMINSVNSYRSGKYPAAKAQLHHEAGGLISGDLAEKTLTGSLAVMKVVVYGSFIFLFPLLIVSGGIQKYSSWITAAFSLALWPSMFSMLNMIVDFAYQPATIVSYSSWSTELKKFDSIASTAANLTIMIPFLSFWITRMGEGGFMHLASSIMATANSASAALAGEKASGSRSWDNESINNKNNDNVASNKHDSSIQYVSGAARAMMSDGSTEMITAGGKALYFGGAGQSSSTGESHYHQTVGWSANHDESVRYETQLMNAEIASRAEAQERTYAAEASALHSIMQHTKTDTGYSIDSTTEEGKELTKHLSAIDKLNSTNNYGWEQNAKSYVSGEAGLGKSGSTDPGSSILKRLLNARISIGGEVSAVNNSSQSNSASHDLSSERGVNNRTSNSKRISNSENYLDSVGLEKNSQNSLRENYSTVDRLDKSISEHKSKIASHNKTMNYVQSNSGEMSKDMTQDVVDAYQEKYGCSAREAHAEVSAGSSKARKVFTELTGQSYSAKFNEIHAQGQKITDTDNVNDFVKANQIDSSIGSKRDAFAGEHNIRRNEEDVSNEMSKKGGDIKLMHAEKYQTNEEAYNTEQEKTIAEQNQSQEEIDKFERDRMGNGVISKGLGLMGGAVTLGSGGWDIGRPKKSNSNDDDLDIDGPMAKPYKFDPMER